MDAMITTLIAMHDLRKTEGARNSSRVGLCGEAQDARARGSGLRRRTFTMVEEVLGLPQYTVKLGIMDEERRTSVNLKECIRAAKHRVAFINTGFLDRTGDEIHTSMEAGPFSRKDFIKRKAGSRPMRTRTSISGWNAGCRGKAQIGKGMWADARHDGRDAGAEDRASARRGPTAPGCRRPPPRRCMRCIITGRRVRGAGQAGKGGRRAYVDALLDIPLATYRRWTKAQILPARWRTTRRASWAMSCAGSTRGWAVPRCPTSTMWPDGGPRHLPDLAQHIANWLHHGVVSEEEVVAAMRKMAEVVDRQNAGDPAYRPWRRGLTASPSPRRWTWS
jgi:malate synthase